jgi:purine-binding chemotaxis protein CheW
MAIGSRVAVEVGKLVGQEQVDEGPSRDQAEVRLRSDYCVFQRGGATFAISTRIAREVLDWRPFTSLPRAPQGLVGAFNLRGEVIPVARLDRFLGVEEKSNERSDTLLVLADGELTLATFVDGVAAVRHIPPWEIQRADASERQRNPLLRGTTGKEGERISILDGERLLAAVAAYVATGFRPGSGIYGKGSRNAKGSRDRAGMAAEESPPGPGSEGEGR